jgi:hypothetical protein
MDSPFSFDKDKQQEMAQKRLHEDGEQNVKQTEKYVQENECTDPDCQFHHFFRDLTDEQLKGAIILTSRSLHVDANDWQINLFVHLIAEKENRHLNFFDAIAGMEVEVDA